MIRKFSAFSGYDSQQMPADRYGVEMETVGTSEIDESAILAAYAIHCEDREVNYPPIDKMLEVLISCNIGLNFKTGKTPWEPMLETFRKKGKLSKSQEARVKLVSRACLFNKNYGDISKINPEILPDMDLLTYSFPCFIEGTQVLTEKGYKAIELITEKDYVMTHLNRFRKVVKPMINKADHLIKISTMISDDLFATEEHPFYIREKYREWNSEIKRDVRKFKDPKWVLAKELQEESYVGTPINTKSNLPKWDGVELRQWGHKRKVNTLSEYFKKEMFWWIVGRYIGDGWTQNVPEKHKYRTIICCAEWEQQEIEPVLKELNIKFCIAKERTVVKFHLCNKELSLWLDQFGKYAGGKSLTNDIINLPCNLLERFIDGYISADGHLNREGFIKISSVSRILIYGIGQCVAKVYKRPFSLYKTKRKKTCIIEGRTVNQKDTYTIVFKKSKGIQDKAFYEDGYLWSPVNKIEKIEYEGYVYNMEVEEDNSYCVQNILVHNCTDISMAGKQLGLQEGSETRSSLLWECEKIIEAKRPKYLMMENVKALVSKKFKPDFDKWLSLLSELGYNNYWKVINAKLCGVPQNRERVFCVSILKEYDNFNFHFYDDFDSGIRLKDILEDNVDEKYYLSDEKTRGLIESLEANGYKRNYECDGNSYCIDASYAKGTSAGDVGKSRRTHVVEKINNLNMVGMLDIKGNESIRRVYESNGLSPALTTMQGGNRQPKIIEACRTTGRNPDNPTSRKSGLPTVQMLEVNKNPDISNCLTTVQKDTMLLEKTGCEQRSDEGLRFFKDNVIGALRTIDSCGDKRVLEEYKTQFRIRKLTPKECFRLMGVSDSDIDKIQATGISNSQQYKLAGNSIVVNCMKFLDQLK